MRWGAIILLFCAGVSRAPAQVGEFSLSGGVSRFGGAKLGTVPDVVKQLADVDLKDGFRLTFRFTLNTYRFFGHEFGYAYNHSNIQFETASVQQFPTTIHQGFYNFLLYPTPEGTRIRPFATGGIHFSSFYPPGASVYQGTGVTKFGVNYGGGLKVRVTPILAIRLDIRQYNTGKPFKFDNQHGRLNQLEVSAGVAVWF